MTIDIEVDELIYNMTRFEKRQMFEELLNDLDIEWVIKCLQDSKIPPKLKQTINKNEDDEYNSKVLLLLNNKFKLTSEEEEMIYKIVDRINP